VHATELEHQREDMQDEAERKVEAELGSLRAQCDELSRGGASATCPTSHPPYFILSHSVLFSEMALYTAR